MNEMELVIELLDTIKEARKEKNFAKECTAYMELESLGFTRKMIFERL